MNFNHTRLIFARMLRGKSQKEMADFLGVTQRSIRAYENGDYVPEKIDLIADYLGFPITFFEKESIELISDQAISFRAKSTLSAKLKNQAKATVLIAEEFNKKIECLFQLSDLDIPDLSELTPEQAAVSLRNHWGLGSHPIDNMIELLEEKGVRVFSLDMDSSIDANCRWDNDQPYIFLNQNKSAERSRFDAAHELGHLVRDRYIDIIDDTREKEANSFASAFLMPEDSLRIRAPSFVTVQGLIELKKYWGVSVAALAYRMYQLELMPERVYTRIICPSISKMGYRTSEPEEMERETSLLWDQIKTLLDEEGISIQQIAEELSLNLKDIHDLTFNIFKSTSEKLIAIKGGADGNIPNSINEKSHLRVV